MSEAQPSSASKTRGLRAELFWACFSGNPLIAIDSAWLRVPARAEGVGALLAQYGFQLPIKTVRAVPHEQMTSIRISIRKSMAMRSMVLSFVSVSSMGQLIQSFDWFDKTNEHLLFNLFIIALFPIVLAGGILARRSSKRIRTLPEADLSDAARSDVFKVNRAVWLFYLLTILLAALIDFCKSAGGSGGDASAVQKEATGHIAGEIPDLAAQAITAPVSESISGAFGLGIVRLLAGTATTLGATAVCLAYFGAIANLPAIYLATIGVVYILFIVWIGKVNRSQAAVPMPALIAVGKGPTRAAWIQRADPGHSMKEFLFRRWRELAVGLCLLTVISVFFLWQTSVSYVSITPQTGQSEVVGRVRPATPQTGQSEVVEHVRAVLQAQQVAWGGQWTADVVDVRLSPAGAEEGLLVELRFRSPRIELAFRWFADDLASNQQGGSSPRPAEVGLSAEEAGTFVRSISRVIGGVTYATLDGSRPIGRLSLNVLAPDGQKLGTLTCSPQEFAAWVQSALRGDASAYPPITVD